MIGAVVLPRPFALPTMAAVRFPVGILAGIIAMVRALPAVGMQRFQDRTPTLQHR